MPTTNQPTTKPSTEPTSRGASAPRAASTKTAVVIGASSGMGRALVWRLLSDGWNVAAIARRGAELDSLHAETDATRRGHGVELHVHVHDVADTREVPDLFERIVRELGGLELLVFAAGIMPKVGRDEYDTEKDLAMVAVNLAGAIAWCNAAANYFRAQRSGTIVGISSVAGDRGRKGAPAYGTTKAALNTYLESLRNRLAESNVHVCTIKPGFVDTVMTQGMAKLPMLISADEAARLILKAARSRANVRYVPRPWFFVMTIIRSIPSFLFKKMNV
jgi:NAD(P)-dependent dehydrogenase (short-subunit alcohol dehydrogenase family)